MGERIKIAALNLGYSEAQLNAIAARVAIPVFLDARPLSKLVEVTEVERGWNCGHPGVLSSIVQARAIERAICVAETGGRIATSLPPVFLRRPIARHVRHA